MATLIILGPPGTGKTTTLLDLVDKCLADKINPNKIGFISFTKKSIEEAKGRACARFNKNNDDFIYFRTIHSLAFRQLGMSPSEVMQRNHYREIGYSLGLKVTGYQSTDKDFYEMNKGDQMIFMESLSRLCCEEYRFTYERMNPDFSWQEFDLFIRSIKKYKEVKLLWDFTDMLQRFHDSGVKPEFDSLFIDEAQDLCRLQWKIIDQLVLKTKNTYIAGDDDQAIFRWSGADIEHFIDISNKSNKKILSKGYRLPKKVHDISSLLSKRISNRVVKDFKPTSQVGKVEFISRLDAVDISKGEWLLLVRNSYLERDIISYLRVSGFSYESRYDNSNNVESLRAALNWEKLRKGQILLVKEAKIIVSFTAIKSEKPLKDLQDEDEIDLEKFVKKTGIDPDKKWYEALDEISYEDRGYYLMARKQGESLIGKPRIKISTIHGAKGGECANVIVLTDISAKTYKGMMRNPDDEIRVFYVALTRAKESLYIVQPQTNSFFNI
jgi:DNA helicase-2/ATP-dependent DNA helicase PcrA